VKLQNRERQRKREQRRSAESGADTDVLTANPFRIWGTIKQFHPHKKEILTAVWVLNRMDAKRTVIAAALGLQGWKTFYGRGEWTEADVEDILER
jgi:hypothetical protein